MANAKDYHESFKETAGKKRICVPQKSTKSCKLPFSAGKRINEGKEDQSILAAFPIRGALPHGLRAAGESPQSGISIMKGGMQVTQRIEIQLLGGFDIKAIDDTGQRTEFLEIKSRKAVSLITYLVLQNGKPVSTQRLVRELWAGKRNVNSAGSLKTTVSRLRAALNEAADGLGACVRSEPGGYSWNSIPRVQVDVIELTTLIRELKELLPDAEKGEKYRRVLELYRGDLYQTGDMVNGEMQSSWLHREYLESMYAYVTYLKEAEEYNEIVRVCRRVLELDELDDFMRIELMRAMVCLNRLSDAQAEYRRVVTLNKNLLDAEPSEDLQSCYKELAAAGQTLQFNLDSIRNELLERENERSGPFFCDYTAFKEIYNIQMRNLERLGSTMFLGVIMVVNPEDGGDEMSPVIRESAMAGLQEIMRRHLRKGDIITRFSPTIYAMLLPTVNYSTGSMVMERMEQLFYEEYASRKIALHHRISPLGGGTRGVKKIS